MNRRNIGSLYEEMAVNYLKENEYTIVEQNFRCKAGEIDIIAFKDGILRFIEVKYRKDTIYGYAVSAVSTHKKHRIEKAAMWYLNMHNEFQEMQCSFDVIAIQGNNIEYIFNSFSSF